MRDQHTVAELVAKTYTTGPSGEQIAHETRRQVFVVKSSIGRSEWATAGQLGFKPEYVVRMFGPDYNGEEVVILDGQRLAVYRTYETNGDAVELYLERRAGV